MAFKTSSLISPRMFREFMLEPYQKVSEFVHGKGVPLTMMDSDGHISDLIPLWIEGGVDVIYPFEVNSGMDVREVRKQYPRLGMSGGIDKRALAQGRKAIDAELAAKMPVAAQGGYVPTVDHALPPDITLANFRYYMERKWEWVERIGGGG
jgi:uroporphyrinogen-III decarboxylase